jgi:hypothetical protein
MVMMREYCPHLVYEVEELQAIEYGDEVSYMIKCCFYDQISGLRSPIIRFPVMSHGASAHGAVINPDARNIADSLKRAFVRAVAEVTGIGYSMWIELDTDPYEEEEQKSTKTKAKAKSRRSHDEEEEEEDEFTMPPFDLDDEEEEEEEDDDELDAAPRRKPARASAAARTARRGGGRRG